jgi:hypothetical protein
LHILNCLDLLWNRSKRIALNVLEILNQGFIILVVDVTFDKIIVLDGPVLLMESGQPHVRY